MTSGASKARSRSPSPWSDLAVLAVRNAKVDEIDTILKEEITPTLERLRGEKTFYLRWSANKTEEERLQRFCVAYEYSSAEASLANADEEFQGMERQRATLEQAQEAAAVRGTLPRSSALWSLFYVHSSTFTLRRSLVYSTFYG